MNYLNIFKFKFYAIFINLFDNVVLFEIFLLHWKKNTLFESVSVTDRWMENLKVAQAATIYAALSVACHTNRI